MSEAHLDAGVHPLVTSQLALRARFEELRQALESGGANRVLAVRAFQVALHERTDVERRLLLPLLAQSHVPGRDARREIEVQHAQLSELARHLHARIAGGAAQGVLLGFVENLARRLAAHASELDLVYYPAIAPLLDEKEQRVLCGRV